MATIDNLTVGGCTVTITSDLGYIKAGGATMTPTVELYSANTEQLDTPDRAWAVNRSYDLAFTLVEMTQANILIGMGTDNAWIGAGPWTLDVGDNQFEPDYSEISITGKTAAGTQLVRTLTAYRATLSSPSPLKFGKEEETNLAMTFTLLQDTITEGCVFDIVDAA